MLTSQNWTENEWETLFGRRFIIYIEKDRADKEHFVRKDRTLKKILPEE